VAEPSWRDGSAYKTMSVFDVYLKTRLSMLIYTQVAIVQKNQHHLHWFCLNLSYPQLQKVYSV